MSWREFSGIRGARLHIGGVGFHRRVSGSRRRSHGKVLLTHLD